MARDNAINKNPYIIIFEDSVIKKAHLPYIYK